MALDLAFLYCTDLNGTEIQVRTGLKVINDRVVIHMYTMKGLQLWQLDQDMH